MSRRSPRKPIPAYLERVALWYLERWFTTRAHLRRRLVERIDRGIAVHGGDREAILEQLEAILDRLESQRILDDRAYVQGRVRTLALRGDSERSIRAKLRLKGASNELVTEALAACEDAGDRLAACRYVRRRRLGPFRSREARDDDARKDLARLARAGFSYQVAREVLDMEREVIEDLVFASGQAAPSRD